MIKWFEEKVELWHLLVLNLLIWIVGGISTLGIGVLAYLWMWCSVALFFLSIDIAYDYFWPTKKQTAKIDKE